VFDAPVSIAVALAEVAVYFVAVTVAVLGRALLRPLRYLFSSDFREEIDTRFTGKAPAAKLWYLVRGLFLTSLFVAALVYGALAVHSKYHTDTTRASTQSRIRRAEALIRDRVKRHTAPPADANLQRLPAKGEPISGDQLERP
jgi:hypothetical protein